MMYHVVDSRAPSLASFAESISSLEEETEDIVWRILPEQREYYTKQFRRLQPAETGVVKGNICGCFLDSLTISLLTVLSPKLITFPNLQTG